MFNIIEVDCDIKDDVVSLVKNLEGIKSNLESCDNLEDISDICSYLADAISDADSLADKTWEIKTYVEGLSDCLAEVDEELIHENKEREEPLVVGDHHLAGKNIITRKDLGVVPSSQNYVLGILRDGMELKRSWAWSVSSGNFTATSKQELQLQVDVAYSQTNLSRWISEKCFEITKISCQDPKFTYNSVHLFKDNDRYKYADYFADPINPTKEECELWLYSTGIPYISEL